MSKIQRGMSQQLNTWRKTMTNQKHRLGWKIGFNMPADQQRLDLPSPMVGYLSRERTLISGQHYQASVDSTLLAEPEIAVQINGGVPAGASIEQANAAIAAYTAALELIDTSRSVGDDIEAILNGNLFHESVLLAEPRILPADYKREQLSFSLSLNGKELRTLEQDRVPQDFSAIIIATANILAEHGEQLQAGDWIITGAAAKPVAVQAGDNITLDMQDLGQIELSIK